MNNLFLNTTPPYMQSMDLEAQRAQLMAMMAERAQVTPLADSIDKELSDLTDKEKKLLAQDEEYMSIVGEVQESLNRELLALVKPRFEASQGGKALLERQLSQLKASKKRIREEVSKEQDIINDYIQNHSNISFSEYINLKKKKK